MGSRLTPGIYFLLLADVPCPLCAASQPAAAAAAAAKRQQQQDASTSLPPRQQAAPPSAAFGRPTSAPPPRQQQLASARRQYEEPSNSVKGSAERRKQQQGGSTSNANPQVPPHQPEECPQCHARFGTVAQLCAHVDEWHPAGAGGRTEAATATTNPLAGLLSGLGALSTRGAQQQGTGSGIPGHGRGGTGGEEDVYRCHHCQARFFDPVALVQHTEARQCSGQGRAASAAAGGPEASGARKGDCTIS